jgi:hypothetical protein
MLFSRVTCAIPCYLALLWWICLPVTGTQCSCYGNNRFSYQIKIILLSECAQIFQDCHSRISKVLFQIISRSVVAYIHIHTRIDKHRERHTLTHTHTTNTHTHTYTEHYTRARTHTNTHMQKSAYMKATTCAYRHVPVSGFHDNITLVANAHNSLEIMSMHSRGRKANIRWIIYRRYKTIGLGLFVPSEVTILSHRACLWRGTRAKTHSNMQAIF